MCFRVWETILERSPALACGELYGVSSDAEFVKKHIKKINWRYAHDVWSIRRRDVAGTSRAYATPAVKARSSQ